MNKEQEKDAEHLASRLIEMPNYKDDPKACVFRIADTMQISKQEAIAILAKKMKFREQDV